MELDPITKWLVRISSSIIILLGLILVFAIPLLALKANSIISLGLILVIAIPLLSLKAISTISLIQETIQSDLKDILTGLIAKL